MTETGIDRHLPGDGGHEPGVDWDRAFAGVVSGLGSCPDTAAAEDATGALRCVSSGYLEDGCSCPRSIPRGVACAAWRRELARTGERGGRFFRFAWEDEVWLAYGLGDGRVRGVYCPAHSAERDRRAVAAGLLAEESPPALAMGA